MTFQSKSILFQRECFLFSTNINIYIHRPLTPFLLAFLCLFQVRLSRDKNCPAVLIPYMCRVLVPQKLEKKLRVDVIKSTRSEISQFIPWQTRHCRVYAVELSFCYYLIHLSRFNICAGMHTHYTQIKNVLLDKKNN